MAQSVVGGHGGVGHAGVILVLELEPDGAAQGVDLLHGDLRAPLGGGAVLGVVAGDGADAAHLDGNHVGAALVVVSGGGALLSARIGGSGAGLASVVGTAGQQAEAHGARHKQGRKILLLHSGFLLTM